MNPLEAAKEKIRAKLAMIDRIPPAIGSNGEWAFNKESVRTLLREVEKAEKRLSGVDSRTNLALGRLDAIYAGGKALDYEDYSALHDLINDIVPLDDEAPGEEVES